MTPGEQAERKRIRDLMSRPNAVFVFGSNLSGRHGAGAAREAATKYGAVPGQGEGLAGRSYALPTKDEHIQTLPLEAVGKHIERFIAFARTRPDLLFAVTRVGCGLAGFRDEEIAPFFENAPGNCELPEWWGADRSRAP